MEWVVLMLSEDGRLLGLSRRPVLWYVMKVCLFSKPLTQRAWQRADLRSEIGDYGTITFMTASLASKGRAEWDHGPS